MNDNVHLRKKKTGKVAPLDMQTFINNKAFDSEEGDDYNKEIEVQNPRNRKSLKEALNNVRPAANALKAISDAKVSGSKWKLYVTRRRVTSDELKPWNASSVQTDDTRRKNRGLGLDVVDDNRYSFNQAVLIHYFANLGDEVVLEEIENHLNIGADINCTDRHGQTVLHEAARAWDSDVAKFLLEKGADVNQPDKLGRTPLHVAAYLDCPELVNLFIQHGADKEALTFGEQQTPLFYAAKNDACQSLRALIKSGCLFKVERDFKGRTPLHVAAELDRSETARYLLDQGAPVGMSDKTGQKIITHMITKMPPVAVDALDQFHKKFRSERKQYFYLNFLLQENENSSEAPSPMQVAVTHRQHDILTHKVLIKLLKMKWKSFGWTIEMPTFMWDKSHISKLTYRFLYIGSIFGVLLYYLDFHEVCAMFGIRALRDVVLNLIFIILWTVIGCQVDFEEKHKYVFPDHWWRIVLFILAGAVTAYQIVSELLEYRKSKRNHYLWKEWRLREIERDLKYAHPRWPEEGNFLNKEIEALDKSIPKYWQDLWNFFDWSCFVLLVVSMSLHVADVVYHTPVLARTHIRFMAITIILLWLRLMKNARAFEPLGPFIVILTHMIGDVFRFAFLYLEFYIPYVCAFLMLFGGTNSPQYPDRSSNATQTIIVDRFQYVDEVFFTLFRLTLVDEYDYDNMKLVDSLMADILLGTWFALSAILCLNLFIALLSDTFQRVYDNAQANAVMQKAITVLSIWDSLSKKRQLAFISTCENAIMDEYDDDVTVSGDEDLKKVTKQIKEQLDQLEEKWDKFRINKDVNSRRGSENNGKMLVRDDSDNNKIVNNQISSLRKGLTSLQTSHDNLAQKFQEDMDMVKSLLLQISSQQGAGNSGNGTFDGTNTMPPAGGSRAVLPFIQSVHSTGSPPERPRRKSKKKKTKSSLDSEPSQSSAIPPVDGPGISQSGSECVPEIELTSLGPITQRSVLPTSRSSTVRPFDTDVRTRTELGESGVDQRPPPSSEC